MKKIIFAKTVSEGNKFLDKITQELKYKEIKSYKIDREGSVLILTNGDVYKVVVANQSARGEKCDMALIQKGVKEDMINNVIIYTVESENNVVYWG